MHKKKDDGACSYLKNNNYILTLASYPNVRAYYVEDDWETWLTFHALYYTWCTIVQNHILLRTSKPHSSIHGRGHPFVRYPHLCFKRVNSQFHRCETRLWGIIKESHQLYTLELAFPAFLARIYPFRSYWSYLIFENDITNFFYFNKCYDYSHNITSLR